MGTYIDVNGVRTWYDECGSGEPLVLLHPGGADARAWAPNLDAFTARFRVFTPERRGHGRTADVPGPMTYDLVAADTVAFLEKIVGGPAHLAGCSARSVVALHAALLRPDLVRRLVLVAGVFHRDGWHPEAIDPNAPVPDVLEHWYAELSPDGAGHFAERNAKLTRMNTRSPRWPPPGCRTSGAGRW